MFNRFKCLIYNRVVLHNKQLNIDFVVKGVKAKEEKLSDEISVLITIDVVRY